VSGPSARQLRLRAVPARFVLWPSVQRLVRGADTVFAVDYYSDRTFLLAGEPIAREIENGRLSEFTPSRYFALTVSDPDVELPWLRAMVETLASLGRQTASAPCWPPHKQPSPVSEAR